MNMKCSTQSVIFFSLMLAVNKVLTKMVKKINFSKASGLKLEIYYTDKQLQKIFQSSKLMKRKYGQLATKIQARLADLDAASNVCELTAGRPHPLYYNRENQYAIDLTNMMRLIFESANDPTPKTPDGEVDWNKVTKVRIIEIEDYHE